MNSIMKDREAEIWFADKSTELIKLLELTDRLDRLAVDGGRDEDVLKVIGQIRDHLRDVRRRSIPRSEPAIRERYVARACGGRWNVVHIVEGTRALCGLQPVRGFTEFCNPGAQTCPRCVAKASQRATAP